MPELHSGDPRRLGSYDLVERLGEGGQGVVYLGRSGDGTKVAIKLLRSDLTEDEIARNRFVREVQAAKQVARFCTAQVLEADVAGDRPYIVSEFVPGRSLQRLVIEEGPRTGAALDRLAIGTVTALVAIHQAGIVHRDFKPHNVLMAPDGPRVIDFGIARALDAGATGSTKAIGTPSYMAPEQVMGATVTEAVDVFSWASTMVYAATGQPPFGQDNIAAVINRILHEEPELDGVPDDLRGVIQDCLAKEPERRPTAQELMMRLIGGGGPVAAPPLDATQPQDATRLDQAGPAAMGAAAAGAAAGNELPTAVLAGGENMAGQTSAMDGPTGVLPPVQGYPTQAPRGGGTGGRSKGPLLGALAAVAVVLLAIAGLVYALGGNGEPRTQTPTPTTSTSGRTQPGQVPPGEQQPAQTRRPTEAETTAPEEGGGTTAPAPNPEPTGGGGDNTEPADPGAPTTPGGSEEEPPVEEETGGNEPEPTDGGASGAPQAPADEQSVQLS